jgi:hypothetical protein
VIRIAVFVIIFKGWIRKASWFQIAELCNGTVHSYNYVGA